MFRWGPRKDDPVHTVHVEDVAGAVWRCAEWIAPLGRQQADSLAGEKIPFLVEGDEGQSDQATRRHSSETERMRPLHQQGADSLPREKITRPSKGRIEEAIGRCPFGVEPTAPVFDLVSCPQLLDCWTVH